MMRERYMRRGRRRRRRRSLPLRRAITGQLLSPRTSRRRSRATQLLAMEVPGLVSLTILFWSSGLSVLCLVLAMTSSHHSRGGGKVLR